MKIIGLTSDGYLLEASCHEVTKISGKSAGISYGHHELSIGTVIAPVKALDHIQRVIQNEEQRKAMADQLRAAATVLETTPQFVTLPAPPPTPAQSAAADLRSALE